ncbi:putative E3 ubiquitin-protein ligase [Podospora bellae-mahoneyi]|uniref:HECT-type E3 ubiquitin transferase n=1 Tax=Podospora bellae-mahoneyi TaxID=2093777 RepID=A0ABR0FLJ6_9PEZI|nr:putative E3 ubiquitin-protein ligase [Podospora bellae-mahoneyi]
MAPWPNEVGSSAFLRPRDPATASNQARSPAHARQHLQPGSTSGHGSSNRERSRYRSASRVPELEAWENLQQCQIESSSSDEDLHPSRNAQRPRHTRSMSHPFPSLFSIKKKKSGPMTRPEHESDSESGLDAGPLPKFRGRPPPSRGHRNGSSGGSRDYSTGNCMTCGSLVRWPRDLHVFKCTICLTINDLQPLPRDRDRGHDHNRENRRDHSRGAGASPDRRPTLSSDGTISLEHTQSLISQCLYAFLATALRNPQPEALSPPREPSTNPFFNNSTEGNFNSGNFSEPYLMVRPPSSGSPSRRAQPIPSRSRDPSQHRRQPSWSNTVPNTISASYPEKRPALQEVFPQQPSHQYTPQPPSPGGEARRIFRPLEDYIVSCFTSFHCLNSSFTSYRGHRHRPTVEDVRKHSVDHIEHRRGSQPTINPQPIVDLDAKLLLLGNFAENGSWWTGGQEDVVPGRSSSNKSQNGQFIVSSRSPRLEWADLEEWYSAVTEAARSWPEVYSSLVEEDPDLAAPHATLMELETEILIGQEHAQRTLLKACETMLKRPGRPIVSPDDLRFIMIIAGNPLLHGDYKPYSGEFEHPGSAGSTQSNDPLRGSSPTSGRHSGIIKRIVGLVSNTNPDCQNHLVGWFARYPKKMFVQTKDLVSSFLAYRLIRQNEKKYETKVDITDGLIPSMGAGRSAASLHAALGHGRESGGGANGGQNNNNNRGKKKEKPKRVVYQDDWQIKAAARVLGLLFAANNMDYARRGGNMYDGNSVNNNNGGDGVYARGQIVPTSDFYTTLLDDSDLVGDFEAWEKKQARFAFCQYPFLLSIGAKIQILEHDARRQMESRARDAFFDSILSHRVVRQFLTLNIRRDCLVEDSLKAVSEVIGGGGEDIKKGLKIVFKGEEGVDAGGLRKEWFLLLVREVFGRDHGMFLYDEDSGYCYFNPNSLEPSEQFFLVGVVLGLAIYNSTILDVALPPFAFRKLLMAAPPPPLAGQVAHQQRQTMNYTLEDLAEFRPRLARGLRQLLEYSDDDLEEVFCLDFVVDVEKYGVVERVPLCPGGERRPVTNTNRREYVELYVRYLLDGSVTRQFEPFKRGFFTVCGGNALSLFRPEEIELLVRGSDEALDIDSLRAVAQYEGWGKEVADPGEDEPVVRWFWSSFERASPKDQRKLLSFITGSDRIPATGAASLVVKISCLGDDIGRYPTARTCFNALGLWKYGTRERLEGMLWGAVNGSEGFGLK